MERAYEVILVDHSPEANNLYRPFLEERGFKVTISEDGIESFEKIKEGNFDIALIALQRPRLDGLTLIRQMRDYAVDTSIIVLSDESTKDDVIEALNLEIDGWYEKQTVNLEDLYERMYALAEVLSIAEVRAILGRIPNR